MGREPGRAVPPACTRPEWLSQAELRNNDQNNERAHRSHACPSPFSSASLPLVPCCTSLCNGTRANRPEPPQETVIRKPIPGHRNALKDILSWQWFFLARDAERVENMGQVGRGGGRDDQVLGGGLLLCIKGLPDFYLLVVEFGAGVRGRAGETWLLSETRLPAAGQALERQFARGLAFDKDQIRSIHRGLLSGCVAIRPARERGVEDDRATGGEQGRCLIEHGLVNTGVPGGRVKSLAEAPHLRRRRIYSRQLLARDIR